MRWLIGWLTNSLTAEMFSRQRSQSINQTHTLEQQRTQRKGIQFDMFYDKKRQKKCIKLRQKIVQVIELWSSAVTNKCRMSGLCCWATSTTDGGHPADWAADWAWTCYCYRVSCPKWLAWRWWPVRPRSPGLEDSARSAVFLLVRLPRRPASADSEPRGECTSPWCT